MALTAISCRLPAMSQCAQGISRLVMGIKLMQLFTWFKSSLAE